MKLKTFFAASCAALTLTTQPAAAHFQLIYADQTQIERPGDVPVKLIFWHPMSAGHVMDMGMPQEFFMQHRGERIDLSKSLTESTFTGPDNTGVSFDGIVPVKRSGDYVIVVDPAPYYEESEDIYIRQITKSYMNRNELPTDWDANLGLEAEIIPLNKPGNLIAGSTFSGRVMANGEPVAGAEIEIEYMAAEPDMATGTAGEMTITPPPGGAIVAVTDEDGEFTFGVPTAGHWGFAALGVVEGAEHEGKELSIDAVIWVRAWDINAAEAN
ncbi:MAG: DUF4198 domain-containing protein [Halocynthiibacter sp.]